MKLVTIATKLERSLKCVSVKVNPRNEFTRLKKNSETKNRVSFTIYIYMKYFVMLDVKINYKSNVVVPVESLYHTQF